MYLCLTVGFPGCGKSTWANQQAAAEPKLVLVSRDDIRATIRPEGTWNFDERTNRDDEALVTLIQRNMVILALSQGRPVIVHNTNLYPWQYADLLEVADKCGAEVRYQSFLDVPIEECIRRDAPRPGWRRVGAERLRKMHESWSLAQGK